MPPGALEAETGSPLKADAITRSQLILSNPGKIHSIYRIERRSLGEGSFGSVSQGKHKSTGVVRAIKTVPKRDMDHVALFRQEIALMKAMDHPNVIRLFESFEDRGCIYMAMELCTGGELFEHILEARSFTEGQAAIVMEQIWRGVFHMHQKGIVHRDLKPENFLFLNKAPIKQNVLKLIDFGLACRAEEGAVLSSKCGTPYYIAPEVLAGSYDRMCDMWSCGVIMFILFSGRLPFFGNNSRETLARVRSGRWSFRLEERSQMSEHAIALIKSLLAMNPQDRCTAEQALSHTWIKRSSSRLDNTLLTEAFVSNLRSFQSQHRIKQAALGIIAGQLKEEQIRGLRETFTLLDANGDGLLTLSELKTGLEQAGMPKSNAELTAIMEGVDVDGNGVIDYTEFLAAGFDRRSCLTLDVCWTAFRVFDLNGDGKISQKELCQVLSYGGVEHLFPKAHVSELLKGIDANGDGSIDFKEFMALLRGGSVHSGSRSKQSVACAGGA